MKGNKQERLGYTVERLYERLTEYKKEDYYPMHMPGHKRNTDMLPMDNPYGIDITEIDGFDNLHQAEGILKNLSERISRLYKAGKSYPLINGSTSGILAGISAAVHRGDKILLARNCHKSVYHAVELMDLRPVYLYPHLLKDFPVNGGIPAEKVEQLLIKHQDIKLVVITSPTYEGVVSDISSIAEAVHRHGALLLIDEAHGAHFGFHKGFPISAVNNNADFVIQSLHKTLPAFTQTAVLHSNRPELNSRLEKYLSIYQSSSPSYLLMAGIDRCIGLLEDRAEALFNSYYDKLYVFYQSMQDLKHLKLMNRTIIGDDGVYDFDPSKIIISSMDTAWTGHRLGKVLREEYHIVMEMEARDYVLGMTSICDTEEGFVRLREALLAIDRRIPDKKRADKKEELRNTPVQAMTPSEAMQKKSQWVPLSDSVGRVSAAFVCLFPPGSPLIVPGEMIEEGLLHDINQAKEAGLTITGMDGDKKDEIEVIRTV